MASKEYIPRAQGADGMSRQLRIDCPSGEVEPSLQLAQRAKTVAWGIERLERCAHSERIVQVWQLPRKQRFKNAHDVKRDRNLLAPICVPGSSHF